MTLNMRMQQWRQKCQILQNYENITEAVVMSLILEKFKERENRRKRKLWICEMLRLRPSHGFYNAVLPTVRLDDLRFQNYMRMSTVQFEDLLLLVGPALSKLEVVRKPISAAERLLLTIRYLASGDYMTSMSYHYLIAQSTVSKIVRETCSVLWNKLSPIVLRPCESADWMKIADDFERKWNFPHCCGCIDGKHIPIQCPARAGSEYYNYKGNHSIVLLAVCDANYRFRCVHIGACGRCGDAGIFRECSIGKALERKTMNLPVPEPLYEGGKTLPYVFVGDEAFPLTTYMMRPFSVRSGLTTEKRVFNYRLSRARRIIENAFGIIASQWRIIRRPIEADVNTACDMVKAIVCIHNWLNQDGNARERYGAQGIVDCEGHDGQVNRGNWGSMSTAYTDIMQYPDNTNISNQAALVRNEFCRYFNDEGEVPWQNVRIKE